MLEFEQYIKQKYGLDISIDNLSLATNYKYFHEYINDYFLPMFAKLEDES